MKTFKSPCFSLLAQFAEIVAHGTIDEIRQAFAELRGNPYFKNKKGWQVNFDKFAAFLESGNAEYSIFADSGNSKLPFVCFSVLPGVTCPGAGDCLKFCYSFRAWRYPAAFFRQVQNTMLIRFDLAQIKTAFNAIPENQYIRLYVDGDFDSMNTIAFWMACLNSRPTIQAYGYSKSLALLVEYSEKHDFPENYVLNLSSGHNADNATFERAKALPITRNEFVAISIGRKVKSSEHGSLSVNKALRAASNRKIFPCPGKCGTCTGKGHACGMKDLNLPIAIAIH